MANHKDGYVSDGTLIKAGQLMTSQKKLAVEFKMNRNRLIRLLNKLENEHQIEQQTSNKNTIITIVNWNKYQQHEHQSEHQVNIKRTSSEHQVNTNKNNNNNNNNNTCSGEHQRPKYESEIQDIILHLNSKSGFRYSVSNKEATKLLTQLLKDGYRSKDITDVIDAKCKEWYSDQKMRRFLAPSTLFRKSNFEKYFSQLDALVRVDDVHKLFVEKFNIDFLGRANEQN
jgi:uncharacterized phage protein (TIGR02220 family)